MTSDAESRTQGRDEVTAQRGSRADLLGVHLLHEPATLTLPDPLDLNPSDANSTQGLTR